MEGYNEPIGFDNQNQVQNPDYYNWSQQAYYAERERLRRKEKINSVFIVIVGFSALIFGLVGLFLNISNPFADIIKQGQAQAKAEQEAQNSQQLALKGVDTDGDGLSDYDEANTYGTNPYLKDSDGDGIDDLTELKNGTDPNCPEGQVCANKDLLGGNLATATASNMPQLITQISENQPTVSITPAYLRQVLIESGFDKDQLAEVPDSEIMATFKEYVQSNPDIVNQYFSSSSTNQTQTSLPTPDASRVDLTSLGVKNLDDMKNLSGTQIRNLMIQAGAPADVLSTVSDDQLKQLFIQQLETKTGATSASANTNSN